MSTEPGNLYRPRPAEVEARQVTTLNMEEIAAWCGGTVVHSAPLAGAGETGISLWTHGGFAVAAPAYWIVRHGFNGKFSVWELSEFRDNFVSVCPLEDGSRYQEWVGYAYPDHPEHYGEADMERAFRSGWSSGAHDALCWVQADAPGLTACDRKRDHKGSHSWDLASSLTPAERLMGAITDFTDLLKADEFSPALRAKIVDGAANLAYNVLAVILVAVCEARRDSS